jgi:glucose/arabinose dehydrogenase
LSHRPAVTRPIRWRLASLFAGLAAVAALLPSAPLTAPALAYSENVPPGFSDETIATGLDQPTNIAFASDGRVFVTEKRGVVKSWPTYASLVADDAPTTTADFQTQVDDYWDRGLLGITVDPGWPARPYVYVLYTYDAIPGGTAPTWGDACPSSPGPLADGCVVTGRLDRLTVDTSTGVESSVTHLITNWCQQFPSHSIGSVQFGADGFLYVSGGDGADFNKPDWGQDGGTQTNTPTPPNPCGDPPNPAGTADSDPITAQGGALRAQSLRSTASPISLGGSVIRIDPDTGAAAPGNPLQGNAAYDANAQRLVAYGLRNPFRFTIRPGTNDLWIGDVGYSTWEELDRLQNPTAGASPVNFGWPCFEGPDAGTYYPALQTPTLCSSLSQASTASPLWTYNHADPMATGDGCFVGGSSISGVAFSTGTTYPDDYDGGVFVADYSRDCIVFIPAGAGGIPDPSLARPFESDAASPVALVTAPDGDILYPDFEASDPSGTLGTIHRIRYIATSARFTATPSNGGVIPLAVHFDGSASTSAPGDTLTYTWDFDDGSAVVGPNASPLVDHTFTVAGSHHVKLTVTDTTDSTSSSITHVVQAGEPPTVTIDTPAPTLTWAAGDDIQLSASATDPQDGTLPGSAFSWNVVLDHCPPEQACHKHSVVDFTGATGSFPAPDHDYPSHLTITVTVTDSVGLTDTATMDLLPKTTDLTVATNLPGVPVPVAVGSVQGTAPMTGTYIVGGQRDVSTAPLVTVGEQTYSFTSWSNGTLTPTDSGYTIPATTPTTLTAAYQLIDTDASDTCGGAATQSSLGAWWSGTIGTPTDEDWYRFTLKSTTAVQITLGDLPIDGRLELWNHCTTLIAASDGAGQASEQIIRSLPAGTYSVRVSGHGASDPTDHYALRVRPLSSGLKILSSTTTVSGGTVRIFGEVLNTTTSHRGPIVVTARLYTKTGHLLATRTTTVLAQMLVKLGRSPFILSTPAPSGFDHATLSVTSSPVTTSTRLVPKATGVVSTAVTGGVRVTGTITNPGTVTMRSVRVYVTVYDPLGTVVRVMVVAPVKTTLGKHATTTFSVVVSPAPNRIGLLTRATR